MTTSRRKPEPTRQPSQKRISGSRLSPGRDCRLDSDFLDRALGETEYAVLRHRQAHRRGARETGIKAAQDAGHDAMRHDNPRLVAHLGFGQPGADSAGKDLIGLAVRRREIPFLTPLLVEG